MTYEITDRTEFKDKFATLLAANVSLTSAGLEPSRDLTEKMVDEFLNQFTVATPAPAIPLTAGYVVVCLQTGHIPGDFRDQLFETQWDAARAITNWIVKTGRGKAFAYGSREVTYFA